MLQWQAPGKVESLRSFPDYSWTYRAIREESVALCPVGMKSGLRFLPLVHEKGSEMAIM